MGSWQAHVLGKLDCLAVYDQRFFIVIDSVLEFTKNRVVLEQVRGRFDILQRIVDGNDFNTGDRVIEIGPRALRPMRPKPLIATFSHIR